MKSFLIHVSPELHKKVKLYCVNNNISITRFITAAIENLLKNPGIKTAVVSDEVPDLT